MKFLIYVEGELEYRAVPRFVSGWLNDQLGNNVCVDCINFGGNGALWTRGHKDAIAELSRPKSAKELIALVSLLDLFRLTEYPKTVRSTADRYAWAKKYAEDRVDHPKFKQHFAVTRRKRGC